MASASAFGSLFLPILFVALYNQENFHCLARTFPSHQPHQRLSLLGVLSRPSPHPTGVNRYGTNLIPRDSAYLSAKISNYTTKNGLKPSGMCLPYQFECTTKKCIRFRDICDGHPDCCPNSVTSDCPDDDRSDELNCAKFTCGGSESGKEIFQQFVCDGKPNCEDGSDEESCTNLYKGHLVEEHEAFTCKNGRAIPLPYFCDCKNDCVDNSDEDSSNCAELDSSSNTFRCSNGQHCVSSNFRCDGDYDCEDKSDEKNCTLVNLPATSTIATTATSEESQFFRCFNGKYTLKSFLCDGESDCDDESDELNCSVHCRSNQFNCTSNGRCVPLEERCDLKKDCEGGEDEIGCENLYRGQSIGIEEKIGEAFMCGHGLGRIPARFVCDCQDNCGDNSDERNCTAERSREKGKFRCPNGKCILVQLLCDGNDDCEDGMDERNCSECRVTRGKFQCSNGECLPERIRCDFDNDCEDGSDELDCEFIFKGSKLERDETFTCAGNGRRIPKNYRCDCDNDCRDWSDEFNCTDNVGRRNFWCGSGQCINLEGKCNGKRECEDGSDEILGLCSSLGKGESGATTITEPFQCRSGQLVSVSDKCDGRKNCGDNSDEMNCTVCTNSGFLCSDDGGVCVASEAVCDGKRNCRDGGDELNCSRWWISYPNSGYARAWLHPKAVLVGFDKDFQVYVARAVVNGVLAIGKYIRRRNSDWPDGFHGSYGGKAESYVVPFEVLIDPEDTTEWVWYSRKLSFDSAVLGGTLINGENVYIGRTNHDNAQVSGRVTRNDQKAHSLFIAYDKDEIEVSSFELLISKENFKCPNSGLLIQPSKRCNCMDDCGNFEDELNCIYTGTGKFPCSHSNITARPSARLFTEPNFGGHHALFNWEKSQSSYNCFNLDSLAGKVQSIDHQGTCIRLYAEKQCSSDSIAYYPEYFQGTRSKRPQELLDNAQSIGPCFDNELDQVRFEWSGKRIITLYKLFIPGSHKKTYFVPDRIRVHKSLPTETRELPITGFVWSKNPNRTHFLSARITPKILSMGRRAPKSKSPVEFTDNHTAVIRDDSEEPFMSDLFRPQQNLGYLNVFPGDLWCRRYFQWIENEIYTFIKNQKQKDVGIHIRPWYGNGSGRRPLGMTYVINWNREYYSTFYVTNLAGTFPKDYQPEVIDHSHYGDSGETETGGHITGTTIKAIVITLSLTALVIGILVAILWRRIRSKWNILQMLSEEEVNEFLQGKRLKTNAAMDGDGNAPAEAQAFAPHHQISRDHLKYDEKDVLGSGHYGLVTKGLLTGSQRYSVNGERTVAIKMVKPNTDITYFKAILSEVKIMAYLGDHDNILTFLGACTENLENRKILVVVEFCEQGDLENYLKRLRKSFSLPAKAKARASDETETSLVTGILRESNEYECTAAMVDQMETNIDHNIPVDELCRISREIAEGMGHLTTKRIIHGDLAARNILLTGEGQVKISDFGLSRMLENYTKYIKKQKTPMPWKHMAYESLKFREFSIQSDVWSYGVTLYEIFSLASVPYPECQWNQAFMTQLASGYRLSKPEYADEITYELMKDCWNMLAGERPTFSEIVRRLESIRNSKSTRTCSVDYAEL